MVTACDGGGFGHEGRFVVAQRLSGALTMTAEDDDKPAYFALISDGAVRPAHLACLAHVPELNDGFCGSFHAQSLLKTRASTR